MYIVQLASDNVVTYTQKEYSKIAKENQKCGQGGILLSSTLTEANKIDTRKKIAEDLDMSTGNLSKAEYIYKNADEELIKQTIK